MNKQFVYFIGLIVCCMVNLEGQSISKTSSEKTIVKQSYNDMVTLSEQEIIKILQDRFLSMKVADDVDIRREARSIKKYIDSITASELEDLIIAFQKQAMNEGSGIISREHISAVVHKKYEKIICWYVYLLLNKRSTAIHEAGHAVVAIHLLKKSHVLNEISLLGFHNAIGFIETIRRNNDDIYVSQARDYFKNYIKVLFAGGISQQIFFQPEYTQLYDWLNVNNWFAVKINSIEPGFEGVLSSDGCANDMKQIDEIIEQWLDVKLSNQTKDEILKECYYETYQFLLEHIADVNKLVDLLMKKDVVFADEVYALLDVERPLFDFEELLNLAIADSKKQQSQKNKWRWSWWRK